MRNDSNLMQKSIHSIRGTIMCYGQWQQMDYKKPCAWLTCSLSCCRLLWSIRGRGVFTIPTYWHSWQSVLWALFLRNYSFVLNFHFCHKQLSYCPSVWESNLTALNSKLSQATYTDNFSLVVFLQSISLKITDNGQKLLSSCKSLPLLFQRQEPIFIDVTMQILSSNILKVKTISKVPSFQMQILH